MAKRANPKAGTQVTAQDVARTIGVSQSTISRAFSMTASISEEMKHRVIKAANKLGYQPNVIARSLITRQTNMVAIVMANLVDPFYPVVLDELVQQVQAAGFQTLLFVPSAGQKVDDIIPNLLQYQVDAIILTSATISSAMARICAARDTPVVSFNRYVPGLKIHAVSSDNVGGGRQVADYLVATGHERLAFVAAQRDATTNRDRRSGFLSRLKQLKIETCLQEEGGEFSYEAGYAAAKRLLRQAKRPDALFFASDVMAFGGIDAARELGLSVPGDVSIVGYDDVPLAALPSYALTTIRQPVHEMAKAAMEILGLGGERGAASAPENRIVRGTLITRSSTMDRRAARRLREIAPA
ncbi:LacI family DNA-binding transcriptional regulator [Bradyrhizobium erythrophlei]|uniref:Transcriptional regulator, LacI family n=1 Tax=Bradyrhizobium erythrophlei TaxID=1437360 RepID=A0A1M7UUQ3_9BRAD|nr:LacI family DNA-binding transcriptional regulator [Bradyrhizobium erythrophlei]SHN86678.1 transcriptional regulator, LacI family [Bradyrhizobium erythrophlei]